MIDSEGGSSSGCGPPNNYYMNEVDPETGLRPGDIIPPGLSPPVIAEPKGEKVVKHFSEHIDLAINMRDIKGHRAMEESDPIIPVKKALSLAGIEEDSPIYEDRRKAYILESIVRGTYCGYSVKTIAKKLDMAASTIKSYIRKSERLKSAIRDAGISDAINDLPVVFDRLRKLMYSKNHNVSLKTCELFLRLTGISSSIMSDGSAGAGGGLRVGTMNVLDASALSRMSVTELREEAARQVEILKQDPDWKGRIESEGGEEGDIIDAGEVTVDGKEEK